MKLSYVTLSLLALACAPFAAACTADTSDAADADGDEVSSEEAISARVTPGEFKLYAQPRANPNPSCDVHTKLVLSADRGSKAHLEEVVGGFCEIYVAPNPRDYRLRSAGTSCGSRYYTGSYRKNGQRYTINITDHRTRTCRDLVPAKIIVEETSPGFPGPISVTKYSFDGQPPQGGETITVDGELFTSFGIGGENTGTSIKTANASYELVLDAGEKNQFVDGKKARVTGKKTFLSGVETSNRPAIDVESMLVCPNPGWINCMPGPNVRLSNLCAADNRSWVQANCPGVSYAD